MEDEVEEFSPRYHFQTDADCACITAALE